MAGQQMNMGFSYIAAVTTDSRFLTGDKPFMVAGSQWLVVSGQQGFLFEARYSRLAFKRPYLPKRWW
jgi:hypothetical protein